MPPLDGFAYSSSKTGLHHLSRVLASHLGRRNVTSNTIGCGPFESNMMAAKLNKFKDSIEASIPSEQNWHTGRCSRHMSVSK